jgi:predicted O-linked N-acetylglucosamine transferase (SPINDLY family)
VVTGGVIVKPPESGSTGSGRQAAGPTVQFELQQLGALFQAGRHADMEAAAARWAARSPEEGQAFKAWGVARQMQGKDALAVLQRAVALLPGDADLACTLGAAQAGQGALEAAVAAYRQALQINGQHPGAHSNLSDVLGRLGQWAAAESHGRQALALQPALAPAHVNLGHALRGLGRLADAAACYRRAIDLQPRMAAAHLGLGIALKELGELPTAVEHLRTALAIQPQPVGYDQLGVCLHLLGQVQAALPCWQHALRLRPNFAAAHHHLANALVDLQRPEEAIASYRQALACEPGHAEIHVNLGAALLTLARPVEAERCLRAALALQPDLALAHLDLGNACVQQGRWQQGLAHHQQAVALAPGLVQAQENLGHTFKQLGRSEDAWHCFEHALALQPQQPQRHSAVLFAMQYMASDARRRADALLAARRFGALATRLARPYTRWDTAPQPERRLRIGLLSADLRLHPVAYFIESVLAAWAQRAEPAVEVWVYDNHRRAPGAAPDATTSRLRALVRQWRQVADLDDAQLAGRIHGDAIDVLIDLSGHTHQNRLPVMAWRAAPVQASWLGYCATTGLAELDAFVADPWTVPADADAAAEFVEPVARLPETFLCFTPPQIELPVSGLPALARGHLRFGALHNLAKINDDSLVLWSRVLTAVPHSQLVLQASAFQDPEVQQQQRQRLGRLGIDASRWLLRPVQARDAYLAAYADIDIALDTHPYPGGTTTAEALWMGVPVLTLPGPTALSRQGASLLHNVGLADWIARDADDFVSLASRRASQLADLQLLRLGMRQRMLNSPLCDGPRLAGHLETLLRGLWRAWCERQAGVG